jgi:hypothetical protein
MGDNPTVLDVNANYQCHIQVHELLSPPSHRILPAILDGSNISLHMLSQYMARGQLPGHVLQHIEVTSVLIYDNGNVVPNPQGYPRYHQLPNLELR